MIIQIGTLILKNKQNEILTITPIKSTQTDSLLKQQQILLNTAENLFVNELINFNQNTITKGIIKNETKRTNNKPRANI